MNKSIIFKIVVLALYVGALMLAPVHARAEDSGENDGWQFAGALYGWGAGIDGKTRGGTEISVDFDDLLDSLEMGFMGAFEARKGKWSLLADAIYLDLEANKTANVTLPIGRGIDVTTNTNANLKGWVLQFGVSYNLLTKGKSKLDFLVGTRYLDLDIDLALGIEAIPDNYRTISVGDSLWDGFVGVKGNIGLSKRWYLPYYLDIGTGDSEFTWQALGGVGLRAAKWIDLTLVYRHLEWDLKSDRVIDKISFSGPAFGVIFRF